MDALPAHVVDIRITRFCWDGWRATIVGLPLIYADGGSPQEALTAMLEKLASEGKNADS